MSGRIREWRHEYPDEVCKPIVRDVGRQQHTRFFGHRDVALGERAIAVLHEHDDARWAIGTDQREVRVSIRVEICGHERVRWVADVVATTATRGLQVLWRGPAAIRLLEDQVDGGERLHRDVGPSISVEVTQDDRAAVAGAHVLWIRIASRRVAAIHPDRLHVAPGHEQIPRGHDVLSPMAGNVANGQAEARSETAKANGAMERERQLMGHEASRHLLLAGLEEALLLKARVGKTGGRQGLVGTDLRVLDGRASRVRERVVVDDGISRRCVSTEGRGARDRMRRRRRDIRAKVRADGKRTRRGNKSVLGIRHAQRNGVGRDRVTGR